MTDGLRNHEIANALVENERALRALGIAAHAALIRLEEQTRIVAQHTDAVRGLQREVAQIRSIVETLVHVEQERVDLRKAELHLEREKLDAKRAEDEISGTYEIRKLEHAAKQREVVVAVVRDGARGLVGFLQTRPGWAVLVLCGMIVAALMGTDQAADLLSNVVALSKGWSLP